MVAPPPAAPAPTPAWSAPAPSSRSAAPSSAPAGRSETAFVPLRPSSLFPLPSSLFGA
ncbi:hypothetical protein ACMD2_24561 [Ananas comosus]|uniref:Uncharacterized protein n=1 Tax=Ananas comosus TaxID=4615 RepID=A0A199UZK8_ANACO|nr:hypothetical protein ACMD2_24561 [Ananas comosus]